MIESEDVVVECDNKNDIDKLKIAITFSKNLSCREITTKNPQIPCIVF